MRIAFTSLTFLLALTINAQKTTSTSNLFEQYYDLPDSNQYEIYDYIRVHATDDLTRAQASSELAILYRSNYNYDQAIGHALNAISGYKSSGQTKNLSNCYNLIGNCFMDIYNYPKAEEYYLKSLAIGEFENDSLAMAIGYNNIAGFHYQSKDYEKSSQYFEKSISIFENLNEKEKVYQTKINHSVTLMEIDPEKAMVMLLECQDFAYSNNKKPSANVQVFITGNIGAVHFRQGKYPLAIELYLKSIEISEANDLVIASATNYKDIAVIYETVGDYENALFYVHKYDSIQNTFASEKDKRNAEKLEFNYYINLKKEKAKVLQLQIENKDAEARELNYLLWLIVSLLLVIVFVSLAIIRLYRSRIRQARQKKEMVLMKNQIISSHLEKSQSTSLQLQKELDTNKEDLINFSIDNKRKNEIQAKLHEGIKRLKRFAIGEPEMLAELRDLIYLSDTNLKLNSDNAALASNIEKINHEFFTRLTELFPNLTTNEKKLCGLIRIKTSIQEIASIRSISPKSVEMSRYRLKKKMQLTEDQNLDQFIERI